MITPVRTLKVGVLCDRKDDLLVSVDDIKMIASKEREKVIDEFAEEVMKRFTELELKDSLATVTDCKTILRDVAEKLKGDAE